MSKTVSKFALTAGFALAMAFTFSCSSDDEGGGEGGGDPSSSSVGGGGGTSSDDGDGDPSSSSNGGGGGDPSSSSVGGGGDDKGNDIGNYRTVVIGTQTWMAENLNYAIEGSKCHGEDGELSSAEVQANCDKYGRLYDWSTAMALPSNCNSNSCSNQIQSKHRGICPSGWHIPSNDDWDRLTDYAGGYEIAGAKLKSTSGWNRNDYEDKSGNGTDEYGFSALPGGGYSDGSFDFADTSGNWWSASESGSYDAYGRSIFYVRDWAKRDYDDKSYLFSVRCVQD
jgi:uncharacterized protein (TIGR02145 family)